MPEFELRLYRDSLSTPWGFRLQGGRDLNAALTVQKVTPCTPADGELERGDVILEIQSNPASRLTHAQAKELIRNAGGSILLRLQRSGNISYSVPAPTAAPSYTQIQRPVQRNVQRPINSDFGVDYNKPKYGSAAAKPAPQQYEIVGHYDYNQPTGLMLNRLQDSLNSSLRRSNSPGSYQDYPSPVTPPGQNKYPTWGGSGSSSKPSNTSMIQAPNNSAAPWRNSTGSRAPGRITAQTDFGGVVSDEPPAWLGSLRSSTTPQKSDAHPGVSAAAAAASLSGPPPTKAQGSTPSQGSFEGAYPHRPKVQGFHYGPDGSQEYRQGDGAQGPSGDSARAAHLQYNSPLGLYSKQAVQEAMSSQLNGRPGAGTIGIRN